jgi:hypothetical protein
MIQIFKSASEFECHLALCHMEFNGGSANGENIPLVTKAVESNDNLNAVLKQLGVDTDSDVIQKASYRNMRNLLEAHIRQLYATEDYYVWIEDFDDTTAVFEVQGKTYSIEHKLDDSGLVQLVGMPTEVIKQEVYISVDGGALILKADGNPLHPIVEDPTVDAEVIKSQGITPIIDKEESMTEIIKSEAEITALIQKAVADNEAKVRAEIADELSMKELTKSAETIVKGFEFIQEEDAPAIVKAMVLLGDELNVIVKAFDAAKASLAAANDKVAAIELEKEEIKKEFGTQKSIAEVPNTDKLDFKSNLANVVKSMKESANK